MDPTVICTTALRPDGAASCFLPCLQGPAGLHAFRLKVSGWVSGGSPKTACMLQKLRWHPLQPAVEVRMRCLRRSKLARLPRKGMAFQASETETDMTEIGPKLDLNHRCECQDQTSHL
eukprot:s425_g27.t1